MSLKSVTGSGGVISAALCLQMGRRDGSEGGNDELVLDHACKLSPQGHITFSCGTMEAAYSFSALLLSCPLRRHQTPPVVFFWSHMGWRFELDRELNHISTPWMCHGSAQRHKPLDISLEHRGSFSIPLSLFITISFSFLNHFSRSASFSLCDSLPTPPFFSSLSLWRRGDPGVSSQEPVRRVVQTTGKMFHFFFLLLHLSNSPLHLSIRVWDCRSPPDWPGSRFSTQITGIICSLKNCASASLWLFAKFAGPSQISYQSSHKFQF